MWRLWMLFWILCGTPFPGRTQSLPRFIPYKTKAGWGYRDSNKKMLIAPRFQSAGLFWNGRAPVTVKQPNGSEANCLIDTNGAFVVPPEWNWTGEYFSAHVDDSNERGGYDHIYFNIKDSLGRWGLVNSMGKKIIEPLYTHSKNEITWREDSRPYFETTRWKWQFPKTPYVYVSREGKKGVLDTLGKEIIPVVHDSIWQYWRYSGPYVHVKSKGLWGIQKFGGKMVIPQLYDSIDLYFTRYRNPASNIERAIVRREGKMGVVDMNNKNLIPIMYDDVTVSEYSLSIYDSISGFNIKKNGMWGWQSLDGKVKIPLLGDRPIVQRGNIFYLQKNEYIDHFKKDTIQAYNLLFDKNGNPIGTVPGKDIHISNDSVFLMKDSSAEYSQYIFIAYYDFKTKRVGNWKLYLIQDFHPFTMGCGGSGGGYAIGEEPLYFSHSGNKFYSFEKDNIRWNFRANLSTHAVPSSDRNNLCENKRPSTEESALFSVSLGPYYSIDSLWGIIEILKDGRQEEDFIWRIRPQSKYKITGGDFKGNAICIKKDTQYAFADTNFNLRTAFSPYEGVSFFRWNNKGYTISVSDYCNANASFNPEQWRRCYDCKYHGVILDSSAKIIFKPDAQYGGHYKSNMFEVKQGEKGILQLLDSKGKIGYFTPDGKVPYSALQFRYQRIEDIGPVGFFARTSYFDEEGYLLNTKGEEWFPNLKALGIEDGKYIQFWRYRKPCDVGGLVRVVPQSGDSFFMNPRGVVYADDDVLPAEVRKKR